MPFESTLSYHHTSFLSPSNTYAQLGLLKNPGFIGPALIIQSATTTTSTTSCIFLQHPSANANAILPPTPCYHPFVRTYLRSETIHAHNMQSRDQRGSSKRRRENRVQVLGNMIGLGWALLLGLSLVERIDGFLPLSKPAVCVSQNAILVRGDAFRNRSLSLMRLQANNGAEKDELKPVSEESAPRSNVVSNDYDSFITFESKKTNSTSTPSFGDVVSLQDPSSVTENTRDDETSRRPNPFLIAGLSILLALLNYGWQYTHPVAPIQLLAEMQRNSQPVTVIGTTNKPTVVDFWAPW